jgi:tetratricopeptide (TPR) repeat protein
VLLGQLGQLELEAEAAADVDAAFDPAQQSADADQTREAQRQWLESQVDRYHQILEQHPNWTDIRIRCGMLLKLLGRGEEAIECFEQATRENPALAEAWVQLGLTRNQLGDTPGALAALETAIQIKPEYADLHYRLGLIYCGEMEFDLAMERLEEAASLNKQNPDFHRQLWIALEGMQMRGRRTPAPLADRIEPITNGAASRAPRLSRRAAPLARPPPGGTPAAPPGRSGRPGPWAGSTSRPPPPAPRAAG